MTPITFPTRFRSLPQSILLLALLAAYSSAFGQVVLTKMTPLQGGPGTRVTLSGTGFNPNAPAFISVNGAPAAINLIAADHVEFTIARGTSSGPVVFQSNDQTFTNAVPFRILRILNGRLQLPMGVNPVGYQLLSAGQPVTPAADGTFSISAPDKTPMFVWVFREETDPVFLAIITGSTPQVIVDARSTAAALAFLSPFLSAKDTARADAVLAKISARPEFAPLASFIETSGSADYLQDGRLDDLLNNLVLGVLSAPIQRSAQLLAFESGTPKNTYLKNLNPDFSQTLPPGPVLLQSSILDLDANFPADYRLKLEPKDNNPLDWYVEVFPLDLSQFPAGRASVDALDNWDVPRTASDEPIATGFAHANLFTANLDLFDLAANWITKQLTGTNNARASNELLLSKDSPGVYVSQAYSGNVIYGTRALLLSHTPGTPSQDPTAPGIRISESQAQLIDALHASTQWGNALAGNVIIAAIDLASVVVNPTDFLDEPSAITKILMTVLIDVEKTVQIHRKAPTGLTLDGVVDILKTTVSSIIKGTITTGTEGLADFVFRRFSKGALKTIFKIIDVTGKISSIGQTLERSAGFLTPEALALERSIVIIGDPFNPTLVSFHPTVARGGDVITIEGYNFPEDKTQLQAGFCSGFATDPEKAQIQLPATILESTPSTIMVKVPTNWAAFFPSRRANICIRTTNAVTLTTAALAPPYQEFEFQAPPRLFSLTPNPVRSGGMLTISATNLPPDAALLNHVLIDGLNQNEAVVQNGGSDTIIVTLPQLAEGPHSLSVRVGTDTSDTSLPFNVKNPASNSDGFTSGLGIRVSKLDMSNAPDGQISLLEAVLIANGTLGRPIERHLPCESLPADDPNHCPPQPREEDYISGLRNGDGGSLSRDRIFVDASLVKTNPVVHAVLPPLSNGDTCDFSNLIIDGDGASQDALRFDGSSGIEVDNVTFRNFGGHGVHFLNGASGNVVQHVTIDTCGGEGVFFDQNAQNNSLSSIQVQGAKKNGLLLTGSQVRFNAILLPGIGTINILGMFSNCGQYGIRIDNGAQQNVVYPGTVRNNSSGGILITGAGTDWNTIGRNQDTIPRVYDVADNHGPGLHLTAGVHHTVIHYLNALGNDGDGILLEGPDCSSNQVESIYTGIDHFKPGTPISPNQGSGIHLRNGAHHNLIGGRIPGSFLGRSAIGGNRDDGILLEDPDTAFNTINRTHLGELSSEFPTRYVPNGLNGIHIRNGSHHNILGAEHSWLDLHILASANAGILIEGAGSDSNRIIGNQIGGNHDEGPVPPEGKNRIGIYLKDGVKNTAIGETGSYLEVFDRFNDFVFRFGNVIANSSEAGMIIENCGGDLAANGSLTNANQIINNQIGEQQFGSPATNTVGIKITGSAWGNIIGGSFLGAANRIVHSTTAGIQFDQNFIFDPQLRNRLLNNWISDNRSLTPQADPAQGSPGGAGILVSGNSFGNIIGEGRPSANQITSNDVGVYVENSDGNSVIATTITSNRLAGVFLYNSRGNTIGGELKANGNRIFANGSSGPSDAGVAIVNGSGNVIAANRIGSKTQGNAGTGIFLQDSSDNFIGGESQPAANIIVNNQNHGIEITGMGSARNQIRNNFIGLDAQFNPLGNQGDGVRLSSGAAANLIGGLGSFHVNNSVVPMPMPNFIQNNQGAGVTVVGPGTVSNSILGNSISQNLGLGIVTAIKGNNEIPPPLEVSTDGKTLFGKVPDLQQIPVGSTIQAFSDPDPISPEGRDFLGEAKVRTGGTWQVDFLAPPTGHLSMTATHVLDGSTSQFGSGLAFDAGFLISGKSQAPEITAPAGATRLPTLLLGLVAANLDVRVQSIQFGFSGTLPANAISASLYQDTDADGQITPHDRLLAGPINVGTNNTLTFSNLVTEISGNSTQQWILSCSVAPAAPSGADFKLSLKNALSVTAFFSGSALAISPLGTFPIDSSHFTVGLAARGMRIADWRKLHFSAAQLADPTLSGNLADPDLDGIVNVLEYAFNLDPNRDDRDSQLASGSGLPKGSRITLLNPNSRKTEDYFALSFLQRKDALDLSYKIEWSTDLQQWIPEDELPSGLVLDNRSDLGNGMESFRWRSSLPLAAFNQGVYYRVRVALSP